LKEQGKILFHERFKKITPQFSLQSSKAGQTGKNDILRVGTTKVYLTFESRKTYFKNNSWVILLLLHHCEDVCGLHICIKLERNLVSKFNIKPFSKWLHVRADT